MKRKFLSGILAALSLAVAFTSCGDDDNKYEYNTTSECIITSMTMGSLKREMHTKDSIGNDSTYYVSVTGALYPMTIDHERLRIYNVDSLPVGTDVKHAVFTAINAVGTYSIRSLVTGKDTIFNLSDSTDFSVPRILTAHATDGVSKREYMVTLNVHQEEGDSMVWHKVGNSTTAFADMKDTKSFAINKQLYIFGLKDGVSHLLRASSTDYNDGGIAEWFSTTTSTSLRPQSVVYFKEQFFAVNRKGKICNSTDGVNWIVVGEDFTANTLVLASKKFIVALKDGQLYSSTDGITWNLDSADESMYLPLDTATGTWIPSRNDKTFETWVLVGKKDGKNVVWKREIDLTGGDYYPWVYLPETSVSAYNIPNINQVSLNTYDNVTLLSGLTADNQIAPLYLSRDNGRTWRSKDIKSPAAQAQEALTVTVDEDNFIWMFCGKTGEVWRGRINRLGWEEILGIFQKSQHRSL